MPSPQIVTKGAPSFPVGNELLLYIKPGGFYTLHIAAKKDICIFCLLYSKVMEPLWVWNKVDLAFGSVHGEYSAPVITVTCNVIMIGHCLEQWNFCNSSRVIPYLKFSKHTLLICCDAASIAEHSNGLLHCVNVCDIFLLTIWLSVIWLSMWS